MFKELERMDFSTFSVRPETVSVGGMVTGVNLGADLDETVFSELRTALHTFGVLFFRDQSLTPESQLATSARFGKLYRHPYVPNDKIPDLTIIDSADETQGARADQQRGTGWHTDGTFEPCPPYVAILRGVQLPSYGGDTMWASSCAAFEALSPPMQQLALGLKAVHGSAEYLRRTNLQERAPEPTEHPVVITDELTGRRALYVNEAYTQRIVGVTRRESESLLAFFFDHLRTPEFCVRFQWAEGSVAMWNERLTVHNGVGDYSAHRIMHRSIAVGGAPTGAGISAAA